MAKIKLLTQVAYARHAGIDPARVSRLIRDGVIPTIDGKINPSIADLAMEENKDPSQQPDSQKGAPQKIKLKTYSEARAAKENFRALLSQAEYQERKKILVNSAEAREEFYKHILAARNKLRGIPMKVAQKVLQIKLSEGTERGKLGEIQKVISAVIDPILHEVSKWKP